MFSELFGATSTLRKKTPGYRLGKKSESELVGVNPSLVRVVRRAIKLTSQDFTVFDGLRTMAEQKEYLRTGVTEILESKHLTGEAVDLVPYINGKPRWEWEAIYPIAEAMRQAAIKENVLITWGGAWHAILNHTNSTPENLVNEYVRMRMEKGKKVFVDGPHYQLWK